MLREAGVLTVRGEGQRRLYRLDPAALDEVDAWIDRTRAFWTGRLDALDEHLRDGRKR